MIFAINAFCLAGTSWRIGMPFAYVRVVSDFGAEAEMIRLDYLSCFLTVVATILVGRKKWTGLLLSGVNSAIVCVIGVHTSQYGFIPANIFCMCIYAFNIRKWRKLQNSSSVIEEPSDPRPIHQPLVTASCRRLSGPGYLGARVRRGAATPADPGPELEIGRISFHKTSAPAEPHPDQLLEAGSSRV